MYSMKTIFRESFPVLVICMAISIGAGFVMNMNGKLLFNLPGILVVIPSFVNMNGSIVSVLSSRISSALHMGLIKPKLKRTKTLDKNIIITFFETIISFALLGLVAGGFNMIIGVASIDIKNK